MLQADNVATLLPPIDSPYYFVTPPYMRTSAGVKVMHLLAHALNVKGKQAYVLPQFLIKGRTPTHPELKTPLLSSEIIDMHFHEGRLPIVVYPEITNGNPLNADCVVRYILNYPGNLGGPETYPATDFLLYYSEDLVPEGQKLEAMKLFIPASDPYFFCPPPAETNRTKKVFYAGKYQKNYGGELLDITKGCIEITLGKSDSQTRKEIVQLFQEASVFYCYENSALCLEAILCGCPVVLINTPSMQGWIAKTELTTDGITLDHSPESILKAKQQTHLYRENYLKRYDLFWKELDQFIGQTQQKASAIEYTHKIKYSKPKNQKNKLLVGLQAFTSYLLAHGLIKTLGLVLSLGQGKAGRNKFVFQLRREYFKTR